MTGKLENKVAIVTGGSRDIGKAISIKLAKEGAKVAINFLNNEEHANSTLKEIQDFGGFSLQLPSEAEHQMHPEPHRMRCCHFCRASL